MIHISVGDRYSDVVITLTEENRRFEGRGAAIATLLPTLCSKPRYINSEAAIGKWIRYNWTAALPFFSLSLLTNQVDRGPNGSEVTTETVNRYKEYSPRPPRLSTKGDALYLTPQSEVNYDFINLASLLIDRRTQRRFEKGSISRNTLSNILWIGLDSIRQNMLYEDANYSTRKSLGSALEFFVVPYTVSSLNSGAFHYDVSEHALRLRSSKVTSGDFGDAIFGQGASSTASFSVVIVFNLTRYAWLYRQERALRNLFVEAGYVAQKLIIAAASEGLSCLPTPAIDDEAMCSLINIQQKEYLPAYSLTFGLSYSAI